MAPAWPPSWLAEAGWAARPRARPQVNANAVPGAQSGAKTHNRFMRRNQIGAAGPPSQWQARRRFGGELEPLAGGVAHFLRAPFLRRHQTGARSVECQARRRQRIGNRHWGNTPRLSGSWPAAGRRPILLIGQLGRCARLPEPMRRLLLRLAPASRPPGGRAAGPGRQPGGAARARARQT